MRVAFATDDGRTVNQHFGFAESFDIYEISPDHATFIERRIVSSGEEEKERIETRVEAIRDCAILYVNAIGGAAAARVTNAKIHPVKVKEGEPMETILEHMKKILSHNPPPWLRKILSQEGVQG